jgi:transposase
MPLGSLGDALAQLVTHFNRDGLAALEPGHGGSQPKRYTAVEQERILREVRRTPDRVQDNTATCRLVD